MLTFHRSGKLKATKATAEPLHAAGVKFAVLGPAKACTGDPVAMAGYQSILPGRG